MKQFKLVLFCLAIFAFQTTLNAQLLYNNGVAITVNSGALLYIDGAVQNESGQIDVDDISSNSEMIIEGNFVNNAIAGGDGYYRVSGNWVNNNTFNAGSGTVFLEGAAQLLDGSVSTTFFNLALNGSGTKTQTIDQFCDGVLSLNDIELKTETFGFYLDNSSVSAITLGTGFVSSLDGGFLSRRTNVSDVYLFPVGSSVGTARYRPVGISPTTVTANTYTVRMANVDASTEGFNRSLMTTSICGINPLFYHQILRTNGTSAVDLDIYYDNVADGDWEGISNWTTGPNLWDVIAGSSTTVGAPLYKASTTSWNDFSEIPYALYTPIPVATISSNSPICEGENLLLQEVGGDAASWSWDGPNGFSSTDQNPTISSVDPSANGSYSVTITNSYGCTASDAQTVTVDGAVDATITADGPFCQTEATVNLMAVSMGGTWSGNGVVGDTFDPATVVPGDHTISYSISNGTCSDNDTEIFHVDADVDATITPQADLCETASIVTLSAADAGGTWSGTGVSGNSFDPNTAGPSDHTVQYNITNGACSDSDTEVIHVDSDVDATITPAGPFCSMDFSLINLIATSAGGLWSGTGITNASTGEFNPPVAGCGTHTIQYDITNGACSDSDTENIQVDCMVNATITPIGPFCDSEAAVTLTAIDGGGTWSGTGVIGSNFDPTTAGDGIHNVQYDITNGTCSDSDNINVTVNASPILPVTSVDCTGGVDAGVITITSPIGANYEYSIGGPYQTGVVFGPLTNGTYTVTVEDITSNCTTAGLPINLDCGCSNPTSLALAATTGSTCGIVDKIVAGNTFGGSATEVTLSHDGAGSLDQTTISASPFSFTYTPDATDAGNDVIITITTDNPEGLPCSPDIQTYTLAVNPIPNVTAGNQTPVCEGGDLTLTETGGDAVSWTWDGPNAFGSSDHNPVISGISATEDGTYNVTVQDINGCTSTDNVSITVNPIPAITIGSNSPICEGSDLDLTETGLEATAWVWTGPNAFTSSNNNPTITSTTTANGGNYIVVVTDANGCTATDIILVQIDSDVNATITTTGPFCETETSVTLVANSAGGTWSGSGVTLDIFDPSSVGTGDYLIQYNVANGACSDFDSETLHVDSDVDATITPVGPFCGCGAPALLTSVTSGGTWSGPGMVGDSFDYCSAGPGIHNIQYNITNGACSDFDNIDITVNDDPAIPTTTIDCTGGEDAGIITVTTPTGVGYEYNIGSGYQASVDFGPLTNGNYTITIQDINTNCTSESALINLDCGCIDPPSLSLTTNTGNTCSTDAVTIDTNTFGGSATQVDLIHNGAGTLNASSFSSSPFSFIYTPDAADAGADVTITITTNNPGGAPCVSDFETYVLTVYTLPDVTIGSNSPICSGNDITLSETGGDAIDWSWTGPDSYTSDLQNPSIIEATSTQSGTYTLVVEDANMCTNTANIDVVVDDNPPTPTASIDCSGGEGNAIITVTAPLGINYEYSIGGAFQDEVSFGSLSSGNYTITVTDINTTCTTASELINVDCGCVNPPTVSIDVADGETCGEEAITVSANTFGGSASEVSISHDGNGTLDATTVSTSPFSFTYNPDASDIGNTVIITLTTDNPFGAPCSVDVETFELTIYDAPTVNAGSNSPICEGDNINLTETGGDAIEWSWDGPDSFTSSVHEPSITSAATAATGAYNVTITDINGCTASDIVDVLVIVSADPTITEPGDICSNAIPFDLTAANAGGTWSGDGVDPASGEFDPEIAGAGIHEISYTISGTCGDSDIVYITVLQQADATILSDIDTLFIIDPAVILTATDNGGSWLGNGTDAITGEFTPSIADLGVHSIIYTIDGACGDEDSITIVIIPEPIPELIIPDVLTPNNDGYNDTWRVQGIRAFDNVNIVIFNRWGDEVFLFNGTGDAYFELANQFDGIRNGKELPFGTYVYLLELDNEEVLKGTLTIIR